MVKIFSEISKGTIFKNVSGQIIVSFAFNNTEKDPFIDDCTT